MEFHTSQAIRKIKLSHKKYALVDGKKQCLLQAMSFAINYHTLDVSEIHGELMVSGIKPVERVEKFLLK